VPSHTKPEQQSAFVEQASLAGAQSSMAWQTLLLPLQRAVGKVPPPPQQSSLVLQLAPVGAQGVLTQ
jgi:hypothetical protein